MELPESIQAQVDVLSEKSEIHFAAVQYEICIELHEECWELLPIPKEVYDDSYYVAEGLIILNMKVNNLTQAKHWATILLTCDPDRIDSGERDMWLGCIAYEEHKPDEAMKHFKVAFKKSKGRRFLGADNEQYYKFYLSQK